jgi:diaminopimelate decarboxylase
MFSPSKALVRQIAAQHGETPLYVYSRSTLRGQAAKALAFGGPFGLTVRYAIKANPHPEVLRLFCLEMGLAVDASSENEALHALSAGVPADRIAINSQQLPRDLVGLVKTKGVFFTATSLHQLEQYGKALPGTSCGVRLNPGKGSGASNRVERRDFFFSFFLSFFFFFFFSAGHNWRSKCWVWNLVRVHSRSAENREQVSFDHQQSPHSHWSWN